MRFLGRVPWDEFASRFLFLGGSMNKKREDELETLLRQARRALACMIVHRAFSGVVFHASGNNIAWLYISEVLLWSLLLLLLLRR